MFQIPELSRLPGLSEFAVTEDKLRWVILAVTGLSMLLGFAKGIGRLIALVVTLAAGAGGGLWWLRHGYDMATTWLGQSPEWLYQGGAAASGLLAALIVRGFLKMITGGDTAPLTAGARMRGGIGGAIPMLFLIWGAASALRWVGGAAELACLEQVAKKKDRAALEEASWLVKLGRTLSKGLTGETLDRVDVMNLHTALPLAALLTVQHDESAYTLLLRNNPTAAKIVQTEAFRRMKNDGEVTRCISLSRYRDLLSQPALKSAADNVDLQALVRSWPWRAEISQALSGLAGPPKAVAVPE